MQIAIISDIHYGEGESHGKANLETGLNTRLEEIARIVNVFIDYVCDPNNGVKVVVFAGDLYKERKPTPTQQTLFAKAIARLLAFNKTTKQFLKIVIFPGNHDIQLAADAHSLSSLGVLAQFCDPCLVITEGPEDFYLETETEKVLITTVPYLYRQKMQMGSNQQVVEHYTLLIKNSLSRHKHATAKVFIGHQTVEGVAICEYLDVNSFNEIIVPQECLSQYDAAFFGHIHTYQVVKEESPLIVNQGNPITLNFGEITAKGFVVYDTLTLKHKRCIIPSTKFVQIDIDTSTSERDATQVIIETLKQRSEEIVDAIVKIVASIKEKDLPLRTKEILPLLDRAQHFAGIEKKISRSERVRNKSVNKTNTLDKILDAIANDRKYDQRFRERYLELGRQIEVEE